MKTIHYVANLVVKRVEVEDGRNANGGLPHGAATDRKVGDVISLTIRGGTIVNIREQLKDHLLIMDDDTTIPLDEAGKVTR